jgi:hypothetical protein
VGISVNNKYISCKEVEKRAKEEGPNHEKNKTSLLNLFLNETGRLKKHTKKYLCTVCKGATAFQFYYVCTWQYCYGKINFGGICVANSE